MKRALLAAVAAAVLFPCPGSAQSPSLIDKPVWGPKFQVTPFVGFAPAAGRLERWNVTGPGGSATAEYDVNLAAGPAAGLSFETRLVDRFALIGSATYLSRGRTVEQGRGDGGTRIEHEGSNFLLGRAALAMRLRESISELQVHSLVATIFAGPAFVHEAPKPDQFADPILLEPLNYLGATFGMDAQITLPYPSLSFQVGIEDYYMWWDALELARRNDAVFLSKGFQTQSLMQTNASHNLIFRAGISYRWM